jgi:hypothetical protein
MERPRSRSGVAAARIMAFWLMALGGIASCSLIAGLQDRRLEGAGVDSGRALDASADADATVSPDVTRQDGGTDGSADDALDAASDVPIDALDASVFDASWTVSVAPAAAPTLTAVSGWSSTEAWAVSTDGLWGWNGSVWSQTIIMGPPGMRPTGSTGWEGVWSVGPKDIWLVGAYNAGELNNGTYTPYALDPGISSPPGLVAVYAHGSGPTAQVYAVAQSGVAVLGYADSSAPTFNLDPASPVGLAGIGGIWPLDVWAVGNDAFNLKPSGIWTPEYALGGLLGVYSLGSGQEFFVGGGNANAITEIDGGMTKGVVANGVALHAVWAAAPDDAWAVGDSGTIAHWDGQVWTIVPSQTSLALYGVWGSGPLDVWAVGDQGVILHHP